MPERKERDIYFIPVVTITILTLRRIQKNPNEPSFFNNRALVRIKQGSWAGAEHDARIAAELFGPKNQAAIKSNYYLAQALLGLQRPAAAFEVALEAYKKSIETRSPNSEPLSKIILRSKQAIWATKETARLREQNETLKQVEQLLEGELEAELSRLRESLERGDIGEVGFTEDQKILKEEASKRLSDVRFAFASAYGGELKERVSLYIPFSLVIMMGGRVFSIFSKKK